MVNIIDICKELGQNFIDSSHEFNSARAFADARDGLKPGQRACLWEMFNSGYSSKKPYVKSAKIAGAVSGNWWPHGDSAIYETFARMSQPWINNIPEVGWHGNNGSQYTGPECASSRYTEARLAPIVEDGMFANIKKNSVNMISNFSEDGEWPEVLPAIFPRLLVNGCQGIGSTIANVWLPHSLTDVTNILDKFITTGEIDTKNIYPSFPTGGIIINKNEVHSIYETGRGKVVLRGKASIGKKNKIYITELPYQVYVQPYVEAITEMAIKDELTGIEAVYNKSGKKVLLIEIECSENPENVLNQLYTKTDLQKSYNANQWALVGKTPKLLTLKDYCEIYLNHNIQCLTRELNYDLDKAKDRIHIIDGLLIALEDIDNVINLIKKSQNASDAKDKLMNKYKLSEIQAKAILAMRLSSLARMEKIELENEKKELNSKIQEIEETLNSETKLKKVIQDRLGALAKKYKDTRKTELANLLVKDENKKTQNIVSEDCTIILTRGGLLKKVNLTRTKIQKPRGKGIKYNEIVTTMITTNTLDYLLLFSSCGKMYKISVSSISESGTLISSLVTISPNESIFTMTSIQQDNDNEYVIFLTKNGLIKKTALSKYEKVSRKGTIAIKLEQGDAIVKVLFAKEEEIVVLTKEGMAIRFNTKDVKPIDRNTIGVIGIKLKNGDEVVDGALVTDKAYLSIFSYKGLGKRIKVSEIPSQKRAGMGVIIYSPSPDNKVVGCSMVDENDSILLIGATASIAVSVSEIPAIGRGGVGNQMIKNNTLKGCQVL